MVFSGLTLAAVAVGFWIYCLDFFPLRQLEDFADQGARLTLGISFQKNLPVLRVGREDASRRNAVDQANHEWQCIEMMLQGGASAIGVVLSSPPSRTDWALSEKWAEAQRTPHPKKIHSRVILYSSQDSFLRSVPLARGSTTVEYPTDPEQRTLIARLLRVAGVRTLRDRVPFQCSVDPVPPSLTLAQILPSAKAPLSPGAPSFRGKIIILGPSRNLVAGREWQALQAVASERISRPRPSGFAGGINFLMAWILAPCLAFAPRRCHLRWILWLATPFVCLALWLVWVFAAKLSPFIAPILATWLSAGFLGLLFWVGTGLLQHFFPSPSSELVRELFQGTYWKPLPSCWKQAVFERPVARLLPVQQQAASLLATAIRGPGPLPGWVGRMLAQMDAISVIRFWTEHHR